MCPATLRNVASEKGEPKSEPQMLQCVLVHLLRSCQVHSSSILCKACSARTTQQLPGASMCSCNLQQQYPAEARQTKFSFLCARAAQAAPGSPPPSALPPPRLPALGCALGVLSSDISFLSCNTRQPKSSQVKCCQGQWGGRASTREGTHPLAFLPTPGLVCVSQQLGLPSNPKAVFTPGVAQAPQADGRGGNLGAALALAQCRVPAGWELPAPVLAAAIC